MSSTPIAGPFGGTAVSIALAADAKQNPNLNYGSYNDSKAVGPGTFEEAIGQLMLSNLMNSMGEWQDAFNDD